MVGDAGLSAELLAFAESPTAYLPVERGEEQILTDRFCVRFFPGAHYWSTSVSRVRLGEDVEEGVSEVRELMLARGRSEAAWSVGPSSAPEGLAERLVAMGFERENEHGSVILIATDPPALRPSRLTVRAVHSLDEHLATIEIAGVAFGLSDHDRDDERTRATQTFDAEQASDRVLRLIVLDGDRPVATGHAKLGEHGTYLGGGATLPEDRGRGAMGAMIGFAWDHAVARGAPALVTFGGAMSAPPLQRLGFRPAGRITHLIDRRGEAAAP